MTDQPTTEEVRALKPCPVSWCPNPQPKMCQPGLLYFVRCNECKTQTPHCYTRAEAAEIWNTRSTPSPKPVDGTAIDRVLALVEKHIVKGLGLCRLSLKGEHQGRDDDAGERRRA